MHKAVLHSWSASSKSSKRLKSRERCSIKESFKLNKRKERRLQDLKRRLTTRKESRESSKNWKKKLRRKNWRIEKNTHLQISDASNLSTLKKKSRGEASLKSEAVVAKKSVREATACRRREVKSQSTCRVNRLLSVITIKFSKRAKALRLTNTPAKWEST